MTGTLILGLVLLLIGFLGGWQSAIWVSKKAIAEREAEIAAEKQYRHIVQVMRAYDEDKPCH